MKFAAFAALTAAVAAEQTCHTDDVSWKIYGDKNCKKVNKKLQKKYGHIQKGDEHLWSGDCEVLDAPKPIGKVGFKVQCDSEGIHEWAWKSTSCKGKPGYEIHYAWNECSKMESAPDMPPSWIKMTTRVEYDELTNLQVVKHGYNAWNKEHCITLFEHYSFGGRKVTHCLGSQDPVNTKVVKFLTNFNDITSSVHVGKKVKLTLYQHGLHKGMLGNFAPGFHGNVPAPINDQISSLKIVAADKAACIFEHYGQKGRSECFTYNEKTGFTDYNLIPQGMNDKVSSINVPENVVARMWQHTSRGGHMDEFWGPVAVNVPLNDQYSHIRVCKHHC